MIKLNKGTLDSAICPHLSWIRSMLCPPCDGCGTREVRDWEWFARLSLETVRGKGSGRGAGSGDTPEWEVFFCHKCQGLLLTGLLRQYIRVKEGRDVRGFAGELKKK
jgi:hypothetical protein